MHRHIIVRPATAEDMDAACEVRRRVFVEEQGVAWDVEYDGLDAGAFHVGASDGANVVGTARVRFPAQGEAKIERMAVLADHRREGVGACMMGWLKEDLRGRDVRRVVLHAQWDVLEFYRRCGFRGRGEAFMEAGIKHLEMDLTL